MSPSYPRLTQMTDGQGSTAYSYHPAGGPGALRLAQEDGPFANDLIATSYDALGRPATRTVYDQTEQWTYDALGRRVGHTNPLGAFTYTYLGDTAQPSAERLGQADLTTWSYLPNAQDRRLSALGHPAGLRSHAYTSPRRYCYPRQAS